MSFDGSSWTSIRRQDFDQPLTLVGIVGSAHDTEAVIRYLWFPVGNSAIPDPAEVLLIGKDVQAEAFEGVYPAD